MKSKLCLRNPIPGKMSFLPPLVELFIGDLSFHSLSDFHDPCLYGNEKSKGYTLLEALIALTLFLAVIVPLMGQMSVSLKINRGREKITAACILEQEAAKIRLFPNEIITQQKRRINDKEWTIITSVKGQELKTYEIRALKRGKEIAQITFLHYSQ